MEIIFWLVIFVVILQIFFWLKRPRTITSGRTCVKTLPSLPYLLLQKTHSPYPEEIETTVFEGTRLTPLKDQPVVSLSGFKYIDKNKYTLRVTGLVRLPLNLSYQDILQLRHISRLIKMDCVDGWCFYIKATGPSLTEILHKAVPLQEATHIVFHTEDVHSGYTSLELKYILEHNIILAMKINDVTIPPERGFPFQVMAEGKYGYKWAKWVTEIEVTNQAQFRGYWEQKGYNNNAAVGGPALENGRT